MDSEVKMQKAKEFMQEHSLTPAQRSALILEKFERVRQYACAQQQSNVFALQKQRSLLPFCFTTN